ncbi:DNA protecting protein DprA [Lentimicrobium saccharophilum]|uniref:DNA protecting protein DprA n=2 Tax=Lentimicrobium saccharophilum TaxID=1678841 RepID=A0A0S7C7S4_9BACT|nr:DNA protecting protein DprA [Lentimicrobium saccharophilum]
MILFMDAEPLLYQIALTLIPGIGDVNARKLVSYTGSPEAVFKESRLALRKIPGIGEATVDVIFSHRDVLRRASEEVEFVQKYSIRTSFFTEKGYPERLKHCADSPVLVYSLGNADLNAPRILSVVGTRRATEYGREMCRRLIAGLKELDVLVVSGLAYGIDTCAHKSALDEGLRTVGVLAHGFDRIYPSQNNILAQRMQEHGGLITEFLSGTNPDRENFPRRNRVIAGLADATIVIEAGGKGGALITADIANSYNRDVFAVPGRIGDPMSEGCNNLIKTNRAALLQSAADVMYIMGWDKPVDKPPAAQRKLFVQLKPDEEAVVAILQEKGECSLDRICINSGMQTSKVAAALLNLEFEGIVKSLPGKIYRLL